MTTIAVLGAGVMGGALLGSFLDAGTDAADCRASTLDETAARALRDRGVRVVSNREAAEGADVVLVATKPADAPAVLDEVGDVLADGALVVSVAAGVPLEVLQAHLPDGAAVIRVMPNTPALLGKGMAALSPGDHVSDEQTERAAELLRAAGSVVVVPEKNQDAVTGVSGSGPAYVFYMCEALIEAGVAQGLTRPVATELTIQTLLGAATMLRESGTHPSLLREQVTSPGGTTAAGLAALDRAGVRAGFAAAVAAATGRSAELGEAAREHPR